LNTVPEIILTSARGETIFLASPVMSRYPPSGWAERELVRDPRRWLVEAPPGNYRLTVRWPPEDRAIDLGSITILGGL
jgi:hypothetical protein